MSRLRDLAEKARANFAAASARAMSKMQSATGAVPAEIAAAAGRQLIPFVRRELAISYARSGLKRRTGDLYRRAVTQSIIEVKGDSVSIAFSSGADPDTYAKANALQYGGVRGTRGARLSKGLKKKLMFSLSGGLSANAIKAHPYFTLRGDQVSRLQERYRQLVSELVRKGQPHG